MATGKKLKELGLRSEDGKPTEQALSKDGEVRCLQRKMEQQRRANNPDNFDPNFIDAKGRKKKGKVKKGG